MATQGKNRYHRKLLRDRRRIRRNITDLGPDWLNIVLARAVEYASTALDRLSRSSGGMVGP